MSSDIPEVPFKKGSGDLAVLDIDYRTQHGFIASEFSRQELEQVDNHGVAKGERFQSTGCTCGSSTSSNL